MILAFNIADIIQVPFGWLLNLLYELTTNYGVALILFAVVVKLVLFPASAMSKKSTMKMSRLTPRIQEIQKKYANDQQKQSQAMQALYKEEGVSMGGGCLWSLLPLLVLLPLYTVVREPLQYMLGETAEAAKEIVAVIREAAPAYFGKQDFYDQMIAAPHIPEFLEQLKAAGLTISEKTAAGLNFSFFGIDLAAIPDWKVWAWEITKENGLWAHIGGLIIPLLSAGSQILSMLISQKMNDSVITNDKGVQDAETAKQSQSRQSGKVMMWMMPIMSLWIGFTVPGALSLYWFAQGVIAIVLDVILTKHYRKIYDAEDAVRLAKHMEEEAIEAEKERIRAERRAANPEGITANTSKKKMQQNKLKEEEAAKAAAAKEYAIKKGIAVEEEVQEKTTLSGIAERPYCKGRAYDPNRYSNTEE